MPIFMPTAAFRRVTDITPGDLRALGAEAVLLDVDNTLTVHNAPAPLEGAVEWTHALRDAGLKVIIVSNNKRTRVEAFSAKFGLPFCWRACKPLPLGYIRAARQVGAKLGRCVVVGDQIFTDIIGANLVGMKSVLLTPIEEEIGWSFRLRRRLEKPFREKLSKKERRNLP